MPRRLIVSLILVLLLGPLVYGCMGRSAPSKPVYYYTVDYTPQLPASAATLPWVLRVNRFSVSPPFNSQRIVYADRELHRNSYGYHQWIAPPGDLLPFLLARDLRHAKAFKAVLTPGDTMPATHNIHGWVEQFVEQDNAHPRQAWVRLHITLVSALERDPSLRVLFQKSYQAKIPCKDKTPGALAFAISESVSKINQTVVQDLYEELKSRQ